MAEEVADAGHCLTATVKREAIYRGSRDWPGQVDWFSKAVAPKIP